MAFWNRMVRSKLSVLLSFQSRRYYYVRNGPSPTCVVESSIGEFKRTSELLNCKIKLYSSSAQAKVKVDEGPIINEQINCQYVRLVTEEGHNILTSREALNLAKKLNLDLVLVQRDANPPVCKIYDYNKEKFKQKIKEKEKSKSKLTLRKGDCKEVRFSAKTEHKDLKMKADTIKRLMADGYRVKCVAMPLKGGKKTVAADDEEGVSNEMKAMFSTLVSLIEDEAIIECEPSMKNGQGHLIVRHKKFGPTKKAGSAKSKELQASISEDTPGSDSRDVHDAIPRVDPPPIQKEAPAPETNRYAKKIVKRDPRDSSLNGEWNQRSIRQQPIPHSPFAPPVSSPRHGGAGTETNRYIKKQGGL